MSSLTGASRRTQAYAFRLQALEEAVEIAEELDLHVEPRDDDEYPGERIRITLCEDSSVRAYLSLIAFDEEEMSEYLEDDEVLRDNWIEAAIVIDGNVLEPVRLEPHEVAPAVRRLCEGWNAFTRGF